MGFLRATARLILRIFFRHVDVTGRERVPRDAPVLFVPNHPNALVDPLLLLSVAPRRLVWLAKEPLFHVPVLGWLVRASGAIPVYRRQDAADMSRNRETFARVHEVLARGGAIALFPEGTSHSDPRLRPLKTGAARMALGVSSIAAGPPVRIVPTGLFYTAKATFRSSALVSFGSPLDVPRLPLDADGEPPADAVRQLTDRIAAALAEVTLQADRHEALDLIARAEGIFSPAQADGVPDEVARHFEMQRRFLAGYAWLRERAPLRVEQLQRRVATYQARLEATGMSPDDVAARPPHPVRLLRQAVSALATLIVMLPPAVAGLVIHFPAYRAVGPVATSLAGERDVVATAKILAAAVAFPLTWIGVALLVGWRFGALWGAAALPATALSGYLALLFLERLTRLLGGLRALLLLLVRPVAFRRLVGERQRLREEILELAAEAPAAVRDGAG